MEGTGVDVGSVLGGTRLHPVIERMSRLIVMGRITFFIGSSFVQAYYLVKLYI